MTLEIWSTGTQPLGSDAGSVSVSLPLWAPIGAICQENVPVADIQNFITSYFIWSLKKVSVITYSEIKKNSAPGMFSRLISHFWSAVIMYAVHTAVPLCTVKYVPTAPWMAIPRAEWDAQWGGILKHIVEEINGVQYHRKMSGEDTHHFPLLNMQDWSAFSLPCFPGYKVDPSLSTPISGFKPFYLCNTKACAS